MKQSTSAVQDQARVNGHDRVWFINAPGDGSVSLLAQSLKTLNE